MPSGLKVMGPADLSETAPSLSPLVAAKAWDAGNKTPPSRRANANFMVISP